MWQHRATAKLTIYLVVRIRITRKLILSLQRIVQIPNGKFIGQNLNFNLNQSLSPFAQIWSTGNIYPTHMVRLPNQNAFFSFPSAFSLGSLITLCFREYMSNWMTSLHPFSFTLWGRAGIPIPEGGWSSLRPDQLSLEKFAFSKSPFLNTLDESECFWNHVAIL